MFALRFRFVDILFVIALIMADVLLFGILTTLFAGYEDSYSPDQGPFMSLQSMSAAEKALFISIWCWLAGNVIVVMRIMWMLLVWIRSLRRRSSGS